MGKTCFVRAQIRLRIIIEGPWHDETATGRLVRGHAGRWGASRSRIITLSAAHVRPCVHCRGGERTEWVARPVRTTLCLNSRREDGNHHEDRVEYGSIDRNAFRGHPPLPTNECCSAENDRPKCPAKATGKHVVQERTRDLFKK